MKKILVVFWLLWACQAGAAAVCEEAHQTAKTQGLARALLYYENCALQSNDDAAEALLGEVYLKGAQGVPKNVQKALLFYHLSAENGNAASQVALAKLLLKLDETPAGRNQINAYLRKIRAALKNQESGAFNGALLHPYTLLVLAAQKADEKWFYTSDTLESAEAASLLKSYDITDVKKKQAIHDATMWKQNKMRQMAEEIYTPQEYQTFSQTVFPVKGRADAFTRDQAVKKLQHDVKKYKEQ